MALDVDPTKAELIKELKARGFVTEGEFSQNSPLMAIAAAMVTVLTRDAEIIINAGSSSGTYKIK